MILLLSTAEHLDFQPPRDSASGLIGCSSLYTEGKTFGLAGLAYGIRESGRDTYDVALTLSCRSPPINLAKLY